MAGRSPRRAGRALPARSLALALALALTGGAAAAHDTWFEPLPRTARGEVALSLATGTQYPVQDIPIGIEQLTTSGCRGEAVPAAPLQLLADRPNALWLRTAQPVPAASELACWAQLAPFEAQIEPPIVALYLDEINATAAVRALWAGQQARGVAWRERYVKNARIELDGAGPAAEPAPVPMGLDALLQAPRRPVQRGDELVVQVLRDGVPLAGLPVEFRSAASRTGLWRLTDAQGRVRAVLPSPGRWVLRGTDLRLSTAEPDLWDSRFLTLAFDVRQSGSSSSSNALSASQTAASSAIASEPPTSTNRR